MRLPAMRGTIDRRLLVNYAVDPEALVRLLPDPFRPKLVGDRGVAGICLIRLAGLRPMPLPAGAGVGSEKAAHRIAVLWDEDGGEREGVFIPRRDTSSRLGAALGGRVFPGLLRHASFGVEESDPEYEVAFRSDDGAVDVRVTGRVAQTLPPGSIFSSVAEVSRFFERGSMGYSATSDPRRFDGVQLATRSWHVDPFEVAEVRSSYFDDRSLFPPGTATFDNALIMRRVEHEWSALPSLRPAPLDRGRRARACR